MALPASDIGNYRGLTWISQHGQLFTPCRSVNVFPALHVWGESQCLLIKVMFLSGKSSML
jgi:hypothetical protein